MFQTISHQPKGMKKKQVKLTNRGNMQVSFTHQQSNIIIKGAKATPTSYLPSKESTEENKTKRCKRKKLKTNICCCKASMYAHLTKWTFSFFSYHIQIRNSFPHVLHVNMIQHFQNNNMINNVLHYEDLLDERRQTNNTHYILYQTWVATNVTARK